MSGLSIPVPRALTQSFPPELIRRILELAIENWSDWNSASTRLTLLRNASLVCKIWSLEAQSLLWSNLVIWDDRRALAKRVLSSSALGKFRTPGLALWSCEESLEVIAGLKGVEDLFIGSYEVRHGLTSAVFSFPSLKGTNLLATVPSVLSKDRITLSIPRPDFSHALRRHHDTNFINFPSFLFAKTSNQGPKRTFSIPLVLSLYSLTHSPHN